MSKICPVCGNTYSDANAFCPADGTTLRAAEVTADLIGSVVADRYLVTDLLGEGGMGKVYLARHVRLPQQAAIKVLRPAMLKDAAAVARFNREAANASRIDHDRVARVYDFGEAADGTVYLAMEYVPGRTLKRLITDTGALEPRRAAGLVRQIAEGLDAAHRLGIVHRDLKPDNIMVVEDGDGAERVKVVDFGIAKALGADDGQGLTQAGYVVGTPEYMSPEQLLGGQIDARSDVYALAIVAYQCLTGGFPFDSSTPERVMAARLTEPPRTLAHAQPAIAWPPGVQAVLDAGLARDVAQRQPSAGTFARALVEVIDEWLPSVPAMRTPATPPPVIATPTPVATPVAPVFATVPPAPLPAPVSHAPSVEPPPRPRRRAPMVLAGVGTLVAVVAGVLLTQDGGSGAGTTGGAPFTADPAVVLTPPAPVASDTSTGSAEPPGRADSPRSTTPTTTPTVSTTPPRSTPPVTSPERTAPPQRGGGDETSTAAARGAVAHRTLDSITKSFDPVTADQSSVPAVIGALRGVIPRLTTADDSTWAHLRLVEAHALNGDTRAACAAFRTARGTARNRFQREAVARADSQLSCY
jgi:serine/threonine-protein kinase